MTINEAKNSMMVYLTEHDSISFSNFNLFIKNTGKQEDQQAGISACLSALTELVTESVLSLSPIADASKPETLIWTLKEKLFLRTQQVTLSGGTALQIYSIINSFTSDDGENSNTCNPLKIQEDDLIEILGILNWLASEMGGDEETQTQETKLIEPPKEEDNKSKNKKK